ncbi:hypothetical protein AK965_18055 [Vibrio sp. PID17_43]|nr:hypothetical protein AK965_18055 [Vibrio sp. PID17_43]
MALFISIISILFLWSLFNAYGERFNDYLYDFITLGLINCYLFSRVNNFNALVKHSFKIGFLAFLSTLATLPFVYNGISNYMIFGNNMCMCFLLFNLSFFHDKDSSLIKRMFVFIFGLLALVSIFMFGNRGGLIVAFSLVFVNLFSSNRYKLIFKSFLIFALLSLMLFLIFGLKFVVDDIISLFNDFGYYPAPLYKLKQMYEVGIASASSGRDLIFIEAIQLIESGNLYPFGVSHYSEVTSYTSPHNFFLEVIVSTGLLSPFIIMAYFLLLPLIMLRQSINQLNYFEFVIIANFFVLVFTKLMLSSSFLSESLFYILTVYLLTKFTNCYNGNVSN